MGKRYRKEYKKTCKSIKVQAGKKDHKEWNHILYKKRP